MFHYCLLLVLLLVILIKNNKFTVEGLTDADGNEHTSSSVQTMSSDDISDEIERIRNENYQDSKGFESMVKKGMCTDEPDSHGYHSCKIDEATKTKPILDLRYVNQPSRELNDSSDYTYLPLCVNKYKDTMEILSSEQLKPDEKIYKATLDPSITNSDKFFQNDYSRGQYPGYTPNQYLDRIRYLKSDSPFSINPDFFLKNGGTYA